jgi:hypothetical protein
MPTPPALIRIGLHSGALVHARARAAASCVSQAFRRNLMSSATRPTEPVTSTAAKRVAEKKQVPRQEDAPQQTIGLLDRCRQRPRKSGTIWPTQRETLPERGFRHGRYWARTREQAVSPRFFAGVRCSEATSSAPGARRLAPRLAPRPVLYPESPRVGNRPCNWRCARS